MAAQVVGALASTASRYAVLVGRRRQRARHRCVAAAFVTPFTGGGDVLQYLDQRMRKEAYDVELMAQAGITAS